MQSGSAEQDFYSAFLFFLLPLHAALSIVAAHDLRRCWTKSLEKV